MVIKKQNIRWEEAVNSLLAMGRFDIYLTGSNAKLLSSELATKIAGRYVELSVFGLGFAERMRNKPSGYMKIQ